MTRPSGGHLSIRPQDVRDDGLLGDGAHDTRPACGRARLGAAVASSREGVYSTSLAEPRSARTRIERVFDPDAVRQLKADASHDIDIAGPEIAAHAIKAGLVGEFQMIVCPVIVGGGKRFFPDGIRLELDLIEDRRFGNGVVALRYTARG